MTDSEYSQLQEFIQKHTHGNFVYVDSNTFLTFLNSFVRTNIVTCENCLFHSNCQIEGTLNVEESSGFCSLAKENSLYKGE